MAASVYKWFNIFFFLPFLQFVSYGSNAFSKFPLQGVIGVHPYYISVVEINHNAADKTLEISCKIFTNDFETTLEKNYKSKVDLSNPKDKAATDKWINDNIKKRLLIKADGRNVSLSYLGFEKEDEAIYSYFQVDNISTIKKIDITNSILHDFSDQQINIIHCIVGGKRQSTKLDYPKTEASFTW